MESGLSALDGTILDYLGWLQKAGRNHSSATADELFQFAKTGNREISAELQNEATQILKRLKSFQLCTGRNIIDIIEGTTAEGS